MLEEHKEEAQDAIDDLFAEHLLPFKLTAHKVTLLGANEYIVRFHDTRLPSIDITCPQGQSFRDVFRETLLERIKRLRGSSV